MTLRQGEAGKVRALSVHLDDIQKHLGRELSDAGITHAVPVRSVHEDPDGPEIGARKHRGGLIAAGPEVHIHAHVSPRGHVDWALSRDEARAEFKRRIDAGFTGLLCLVSLEPTPGKLLVVSETFLTIDDSSVRLAAPYKTTRTGKYRLTGRATLEAPAVAVVLQPHTTTRSVRRCLHSLAPPRRGSSP